MFKRLKPILLGLLSLFGMTESQGQTGPGGVGTRDGSSSLSIWLTANDLNANENTADNPANGTRVSTWNDYSGNNNNFTQSGNNRPTYTTTGTFNAVNFNAAPGTAQFMNGTITGTFSNASAYFVLNPVNSGNSNSLFDNPSSSLRVEQWSNTNRVGFTRYGVGDYRTGIASPFNNDAIFSYHKNTGVNTIEVRVNNATENLGIGSTTAGIPVDRIGRNSNGSDEASGNFYEVIFFNTSINSAQKIIVDNYLSAKYNSIAIPTDIYTQDNAAAGNFDFDVAGIGRVDASNLHTDAQGTGVIRILNPTGLGNNEFLLWGHDNANFQLSSSTNAPDIITSRLQRIWRVNEVNSGGTAVDVGAVDLRIDTSGLTGISTGNLRLLVDTDNDGSFADETPISGATNLGSNVFQFAGITALTNNVRYTFGLATTTIITNRRITIRVNK